MIESLKLELDQSIVNKFICASQDYTITTAEYMYKSLLLLIFLGLITPLLNTKVVGENALVKGKALAKDVKPLFKVGADNDNAEEVVDFWDFNPSSNTKSAKKVISNVIKAAKTGNISAIKKSVSPVYKGYASKAEKKELKEMNQLLDEMDRLLGFKKVPSRRLELLPEGNAEEGLQSQEEVIIGDNTNTGTGNTQTDSDPSTTEGEESTTTPITGNEATTGSGNTDTSNDIDTPTTSNTVSEGMATVAFTGTLRYDTDFDAFQSNNGKQVFINALSKTLDINQNTIKIVGLKRGSVIINFEIASTAADSESTDTAVAKMNALSNKLSTAIKNGDMKIFGATITDYTPQVLVYKPTTTKNPVSGRYYVMGAALLVTILMTSALVWFLYRNRRANEPKLLSGQARYKLSYVPESKIEFADLEEGRQDNPNSLNSNSGSGSLKMYAASPYSAGEQPVRRNSKSLNKSIGKSKVN